MSSSEDIHAQVVVLGSGPGGYTAAFRAADLGADVVLIERYRTLGGVCLNVGCIPSKALLHAVKTLTDAQDAATYGISFATPQVDLDRLRTWKDGVVTRLTEGLAGMADRRKVRVITGTGTLTGPNTVVVGGGGEDVTIGFDHAILATGSRAAKLPGIPGDDPRVIDATGALELRKIPERLLIIGGGIIGLEMATVYDALGAKVTVVELSDQLIPGCDPDLVRPLARRIAKRYQAIHLRRRVQRVDPHPDGLRVILTSADGGDEDGATLGSDGVSRSQTATGVRDRGGGEQVFDCVLVAVGRMPNSDDIGLQQAGVKVDERGYVTVDSQMRTNVSHIHAIGDLVGPPMLAHKATHEAKVAAEVIAGHNVAFDPRGIPSVAYTDPEIAWVGQTEILAKAAATAYESAVFPWAASGRAIAMDTPTGMTKLLFDPDTHRLLGGGIVGSGAGELIAEVTLALEMGADIEDIALTSHPHPTLSETVGLAAEVGEGTITDLPPSHRSRA